MDPIIASSEITLPKVSIFEAEDKDREELKDLPYGIKLTWGIKLRGYDLTGKGVKIPVIDSGIDATHSGFHGMVTKSTWFRYSSPLSKDDYGKHVAGTIHMMDSDAEIYDYRVFGSDGSFSVDKSISTSIYEVIFDGCGIINMSLGA